MSAQYSFDQEWVNERMNLLLSLSSMEILLNFSFFFPVISLTAFEYKIENTDPLPKIFLH